jgi:hypothetical protein
VQNAPTYETYHLCVDKRREIEAFQDKVKGLFFVGDIEKLIAGK